METIPIAHLEKRNGASLDKSIRGVVTLIWPYSSSTRKAALLLAEPDFRLRKSKGQVRVQLSGVAAEEIAKSKIASGDEVVLSLAGARWVEAAPGISTPGRSVDVELEYRRRMICEIHREGTLLKNLDVNDQSPSDRGSSPGSPATPYLLKRPLSTPYLGRVTGLSTPASSAFHRRARVVSGELVDSPYDPFANDGRAVGHDRKRQRLSWGNDARWSLNERRPSPSKTNARDDWIRDEDLQSPTKVKSSPVKAREPITPTSPSPGELSSPVAPRATDSQIEAEEGRRQYTQELVDLASGDTEEEDFSQFVNTGDDDDEAEEDENDAAISNAFSAPNIFVGKKFSVFKDVDESSAFGASTSTAGSDGPPLLFQQALKRDEEQLLDLPSSDPVEQEPQGPGEQDVPSGTFEALPSEVDPRTPEALPSAVNPRTPEAQQEQEPEHAVLSEAAQTPIAELVLRMPERKRDPVVETDSEMVMPNDHAQNQASQPQQKPSSETEADSTPKPSSLRITNMPPPALPTLPTLDTATLENVLSNPMAPPPLSALPRSPRTPDLQPQQSAALPLPSPFPGEELSSYMDVTPTVTSSFIAPPAATSPILPDWMFQAGFGFGSQVFTRSPSKEGQLGPAVAVEPQVQIQEAEVEMSGAGVEIPKPGAASEVQELDASSPLMQVDGTAVEPKHEDSNYEDEEQDDDDRVPTRSRRHAPYTVSLPSKRLTAEAAGALATLDSSIKAPAEEPASAILKMGTQPSLAIELSSDPATSDQVVPVASSPKRVETTAATSSIAAESEAEQSESEDEEEGSEESEDSDVDSEIEDSDDELDSVYGEGLRREADEEIGKGSEDEMEREEENAALPQRSLQSSPQKPPKSSVPVVIDLLDSDDEDEDEDEEGNDDVDAREPLRRRTPSQVPYSSLTPEPMVESPDDALPTSLFKAEDTAVEALTSLASSSQPDAAAAPEVGSLHEPSMPTRGGVSFAPRVTRRRAAVDAESTAEFEPQSSMELANSQQHFRPPRLRVQDTFEGMAHSDGSLTTAPPSRGSDGSALSAMDPIEEEGTRKRATTILEMMHQREPEVPNFDGAHDDGMDFIASSPPIASLETVDEVAYPALPPLTEYETAQEARTGPFGTAHEFTNGNSVLATPEASQQLSQQTLPQMHGVQAGLQLPPTPHQTQLDQSFYSAKETDELIGHAEDHTEDHDQLQTHVPETVQTPMKEIQQPMSDLGSSVLSPWFGAKPTSMNAKRQSIDEHFIGIQDTADLQDNEQSQIDPQVKQDSPTKAAPTKLSSSPKITQQEEIIQSQLELPDFSFTQSQSQAAQARGLLTNISYYTPLSGLYSYIRMPSNSQGYNDGCVDVIALVTKETTKPKRADGGQRDWYTTLSITDEYFHPKSLRVQIFRPWRAALPKAEKGDVILLRGFEVFSAKGGVGVGLKSAESAAWCAWRNTPKDNLDLSTNANDKPHARRQQTEIVEEMRGPPVELGDLERDFAGDLREWWSSVASQDVLTGPIMSNL